MKKAYLLGDMHTANAFRLAGIEVTASSPDRASLDLDLLLNKQDAALILVTREIAKSIQTEIYEINLNQPYPVIIEIPGVHDSPGFQTSVLDYITEALGISI